jgi:hypothetical protein
MTLAKIATTSGNCAITKLQHINASVRVELKKLLSALFVVVAGVVLYSLIIFNGRCNGR